MKIRKLSIGNFRGIKKAELFLPDHVVLIGDNNVGKSTIFESLDLVLGPDRLNKEAQRGQAQRAPKGTGTITRFVDEDLLILKQLRSRPGGGGVRRLSTQPVDIMALTPAFRPAANGVKVPVPFVPFPFVAGGWALGSPGGFRSAELSIGGLRPGSLCSDDC